MGDAVRPGDRDHLAVGMEGRRGLQVRVVLTHLGLIVGGGHRADLEQAELAEGVKDSRVDVKAGGINEGGIRGGVDGGADCRDLAVRYQDVAGEGLSGDRMDCPSPDDE